MPNQGNSTRKVDVLIIGGGVIGCSLALRLAQAKLQVTVLDRNEIGLEASSAAAGMIGPHAEAVEPADFFNLSVASRDLYPQFATEIEELSGERVGYRRDGTLLVSFADKDDLDLENVYHIQKNLGFAPARLTASQVLEAVPRLSPQVRGGLLLPGDHWVDNERLMHALFIAGRRLGVSFHTRSAVRKLNGRDRRVQSLEVDSGTSAAPSIYTAERYVLAAGSWSGELAATLGLSLPMTPCRGQMLEFESAWELPIIVRHGLHYLVPRSGRRIAMGTTAEYAGFDRVVTGEGLRSIVTGVAELTPHLADMHFRRAWAGLRPDTADHLPILGYGDWENLLFATGHFRHGILLAPITAQLLAELILSGQASQPLDLYRPARFGP
jgi:glycine oxidase